jgi:dimethylglycine dehydrogenase
MPTLYSYANKCRKKSNGIFAFTHHHTSFQIVSKAGLMKSQARVVVIGGGVVGCSVLYHLTKLGWSDVVLLERDELTSGSTWHAAGGMHTINGDPNVAKLQQYTINLYKEIADLSGQDAGVHITGGVMLAASEARLDWLKSLASKGAYLGIDADIISSEEAMELMPLIDPSKFAGAMRTYVDGHLDPSGVTHAYAKAARKLGADVERFTKVEDLVQNRDGSWRVITNKGEITAEHVVNAGGLWAREVGRMVGLELPLLAMEHMYLITEDMPEVAEWNKKTGKEIIHAVDFDGELYLRQERGGMLMGTYEQACKPWSPDHTPWDFGHELLEPDIDRIAPSLEVGFEHFPAFKNAGIKQIINGPFTFAPDGNPLVGPVRGLQNYWCACAVMAGFSQGGGVGLALSNWIVEGDPGMDIWAMDVARYGNWATPQYTSVKVQENYRRRFSIRFPNETLPAARPLKTTPIYDRLKAAGAQFGDSWGLESALWFAPEGEKDEFSWYRSTDFKHVGNEVRAVRESVGMFEISGFANYTVSGKSAKGWLDRMLACNIPNPGRMVLAPMLKEDGKIIGDFTLANVSDQKLEKDEFFISGSGVAEDYHMRWFEKHLPDDGSVSITAHGVELTGLSIAGPNARKVLAAVTRYDVSPENFKFMAIAEMNIGLVSALVGRISFTGDLGYEIWCKPEYLTHIFDQLMLAGQPYDIALFGSRALNSLRLEKGYGSWGSEYRPIYTPIECGLDRFVNTNKEENFIGKKALAEGRPNQDVRLCTFVVDVDQADAVSDEPIYFNGEVKGWVTSAGFAHASNVSVALGYVPAEIAGEQDGWEIEIIGKRHKAKLQNEPLFDPNGSQMRS